MKLAFRATMWWLVGWSTALSGEDVVNLDEDYREDYELGRAAALGLI